MRDSMSSQGDPHFLQLLELLFVHRPGKDSAFGVFFIETFPELSREPFSDREGPGFHTFNELINFMLSHGRGNLQNLFLFLQATLQTHSMWRIYFLDLQVAQISKKHKRHPTKNRTFASRHRLPGI